MINSEGIPTSGVLTTTTAAGVTTTATAATTATSQTTAPSTPSTPLISVIGDFPDATHGHAEADVFSNTPTIREISVTRSSSLPSSKKRKVVISNSSVDSANRDSDDDDDVRDKEAMEEGELDRSSCVEDLSTSASSRETANHKNEAEFEKTLKKILNECKSLREDIEVLRAEKAEKTEFKKEIEKIVREVFVKEKKTWIAEMKKEIRSSVGDLEATIEESKVKAISQEVTERVSYTENKLIDLECRSRRNNLILFGVKEAPGERYRDAERIVRDIIHYECDIDDSFIIIERAHRLGKRQSSKNRPIIIKFLDYNDKMFVKSRRFDLPPSLSLADDLPFCIRQAQQELLPELKAAKEQGKDAFIRFPATLVVEGRAVRTVEVKAPQPSSHTPDKTESRSGRRDEQEEAWQPASRHNARRFRQNQNRGSDSGSSDDRQHQRDSSQRFEEGLNQDRRPYSRVVRADDGSRGHDGGPHGGYRRGGRDGGPYAYRGSSRPGGDRGGRGSYHARGGRRD